MTELLKLKSVAAKTMFAASQAEIENIRTAAGFSKDQFDRVFLPLLFDYALNVQDLPLSKNWYHKPGGAWSFGLFLSVLTLRVSASRMFFPECDSIERRSLEPQCRFAAFAAGLASGIAILAQSARLADQTGAEFHPLTASSTLHDWLDSAKGATFNWRQEADALTKPECAAIAARFLRANIMERFDLRVVRMTYGAVYPQSAPNATETTLSKVIRESIDACAKRYVEKFYEEYDPHLKAAAVPTMQEASALAKDLAEQGVHREIENPLEAPAGVDPDTGEIIAAKSVQSPSAANTGAAAALPSPKAPPAAPVSRPAPVRPLSVQPSLVVHAEAPVPEVTHLTLLEGAAPELQDWFKALRAHERYDRLRDKLKITEDGIEVPCSLIGNLGLNLASVMKFMTEAKMVTKTSKDLQTVFLHPALQPLFFDAE